MCKQCDQGIKHEHDQEYVLRWQGENIDEASCLDQAEFLQGEYNLAYGGGVTIHTTKGP